MIRKKIECNDTLRKYILERLHNKTYRDLVKETKFKRITGIKSLGALSYYARKMKITMREVYDNGISMNLIPSYMSYEQWTVITNRRNIVNQRKHIENLEKQNNINKKEVLLKLSKEYNIPIRDNEDTDIIYELLITFIDKKTIDNELIQYNII